jgi:hypothetical protein
VQQKDGAMPKQQIGIPIWRKITLSEADQLVPDVAYTLWLSSAFFGGSPEAAFFTALQLVKGKSSVACFLVHTRKDDLHPD